METKELWENFRSGGLSTMEVSEAWIDIPKAPKHLHKNQEGSKDRLRVDCMMICLLLE